MKKREKKSFSERMESKAFRFLLHLASLLIMMIVIFAVASVEGIFDLWGMVLFDLFLTALYFYAFDFLGHANDEEKNYKFKKKLQKILVVVASVALLVLAVAAVINLFLLEPKDFSPASYATAGCACLVGVVSFFLFYVLRKKEEDWWHVPVYNLTEYHNVVEKINLRKLWYLAVFPVSVAITYLAGLPFAFIAVATTRVLSAILYLLLLIGAIAIVVLRLKNDGEISFEALARRRAKMRGKIEGEDPEELEESEEPAQTSQTENKGKDKEKNAPRNPNNIPKDVEGAKKEIKRRINDLAYKDASRYISFTSNMHDVRWSGTPEVRWSGFSGKSIEVRFCAKLICKRSSVLDAATAETFCDQLADDVVSGVENEMQSIIDDVMRCKNLSDEDLDVFVKDPDITYAIV